MALRDAPTEPEDPHSRRKEQDALATLSMASALVELANNLSDQSPTLAGVGALAAATVLIVLCQRRNDR